MKLKVKYILPNIVSKLSIRKCKQITDYIRENIVKTIYNTKYRLGISIINNLDCSYHFGKHDFKIVPIFEGNWFIKKLIGFKLIEYVGSFRLFSVISGTETPSNNVKIIYENGSIEEIVEYIKNNVENETDVSKD